jgi:hypothetical protein
MLTKKDLLDAGYRDGEEVYVIHITKKGIELRRKQIALSKPTPYTNEVMISGFRCDTKSVYTPAAKNVDIEVKAPIDVDLRVHLYANEQLLEEAISVARKNYLRISEERLKVAQALARTIEENIERASTT